MEAHNATNILQLNRKEDFDFFSLFFLIKIEVS